ncbi:ATP-binding response regulator [Hydrogenophaga sp.]|uniref:ATP-binding response regulator n=3 Tax=Hydrogenophaga sp. TaxID=1904254 RepID=UPI003D0ADCE1
MLQTGSLAPKQAPPLAEDPHQTQLIDAQLLARSIKLVIQQSRMGMVTALVVTLALGGLFVPTAGWALYLAWACPVAAGFVLRQTWFERLQRRAEASGVAQLTKITTVSAITGWMAIMCLPLFAPHLPLADALFLGTLLLAWVVGAVAVLGVQPRVYALYMLATLTTIFATLWPRLGPLELWIMGLAITMGALMMYRLARGMRSLLRDSVVESQRNEQLAQQLEEALQAEKQVGARNQQLAEQLEAALHAQRLTFETRSRFLAAASHDMRQPVQALTLLVNVLRRTQNDLRRSEVVEEIGQATQSIESMFSGLLDIASIDAGRLQAQVCPVELLPLLRTTLAGYAGQCEDKGLRLTQRLEVEPVVLADPLLLQRVMRNLLDNALKYTPSGAIGLEVRAHDAGVLIALRDSGIGMSEDEQRGLFQAFTRGASAQEFGVPGLGLGLAIARHMADLMGATLRIESRKNEGTTALLWLRRDSLSVVQPPPGELPAALTGEHAVVLEDDSLARAAMTHWLQEAGATVTSAASGTELWLKLGSAPPPTLVVADVHLGPNREDGVQVVQQLRRVHPAVRAVMVTGETAPLAIPPDVAVLRKPVDIQALVKALQR